MVRAPLRLAAAAILVGGCGGGGGGDPPRLGTPPGVDGGARADAAAITRDAAAPQPDAARAGGDTGAPPADAGCGWHGEGTPLHVAAGVDVCLPHVACNSETCPPTVGTCVDDACQFNGAYDGVATVPEAWATYYCTLSTGGCHGVTQIEYPEVTAGKISQAMGAPLCEGDNGSGTCVGIAASSPMVVGNSQEAVDQATGQPVKDWGLGLTEASGLCYEITGPGGTAVVALTDRCGGYCRCGGSGFQECGPCVNAPDMEPYCACVGAVPGLYTSCCGRGCATTQADCDWCASNNHAHFDLDTGTFNHVCGSQADLGSCQMTSARYVPCLPPSPAWPP